MRVEAIVRRARLVLPVAVSGVVVVLSAPSAAFAYIDPGSGALLFQSAIAGLFGAVFVGRRMLLQIVSRLRRGSAPSDPGSTNT